MTFKEKQDAINDLYLFDKLSDMHAYATMEGEDEVILAGRFNLDDLKKIVAIMEQPE